MHRQYAADLWQRCDTDSGRLCLTLLFFPQLFRRMGLLRKYYVSIKSFAFPFHEGLVKHTVIAFTLNEII